MSRFFSLIMAFLLVTSGVAGFSGQAAAANNLPPGCSQLDNFIHDLITYQNINEGESDCSTQARIDEAIQQVNQADANQTEVDIHQAAVSQVANTETFLATHDNYIQDSENVAWSKAEIAIAEAYQNNSTKAEARQAARQAIADYYATKQINLIEHWNVSASSMNTLDERAENESSIDSEFVGIYGNGSNWGRNVDGVFGIENTTTTLVNSQTHGVIAVTLGSQSQKKTIPETGLTDNSGYQIYRGVSVLPPNSSYSEEHALVFEEYESRWDTIVTKTNNLQAEADRYVNATWPEYESGNISASDVISSNTAMFEYGTEGQNESDGIYRSTAALSLLGFDTTDLDNSGTMDVTYNNTTYTGIVLARNAPGDQWQSGKTYNTGNITGPVFMATTGADKVEFADNTTFTIESIRAQDGTNIQQINTTQYNYRTANTSELLEKQQRLTNLRQEIEARQQQILSGGGSGGGFFPDGLSTGVIAGAGAVILLLVGIRGGN